MEESSFSQISHLIASQTGLLLREQDDALLRQVVAGRMKARHLSDVEQYARLLASDAGILREREELVVSLTTGESYFFRDSGQHALMRETIMPELIERRRNERSLRIWCAACAAGEEAYSLAILLDELMEDQSQWNILILGTDINHHLIERAQRGIYTEWSFRGMSRELRQRYFEPHKDTWVLNDRIRRRVTFQRGDLLGDIFPDRASQLYDMDLILCRNVFIYMAPKAVSLIVDKFTETLLEGGILITGHGELYAHTLGGLRARVCPESIVYQKAESPALCQWQTTPVETSHPEPALPRVPAPAPVAAGETEISEMTRAWQYANQGRRELAEQACREMIARNSLEAEPYYLMALLAQERGDFSEARELLKKVIYLDHSFVAAYLDLGDLYARAGEGDRAIKMRTTARDLLKRWPGDQPLKFYGASTADKVLQYAENLLHQ